MKRSTNINTETYAAHRSYNWPVFGTDTDLAEQVFVPGIASPPVEKGVATCPVWWETMMTDHYKYEVILHASTNVLKGINYPSKYLLQFSPCVFFLEWKKQEEKEKSFEYRVVCGVSERRTGSAVCSLTNATHHESLGKLLMMTQKPEQLSTSTKHVKKQN